MNAAATTLNELHKAAGSLSGMADALSADALSRAKQSRGEKKARKVSRAIGTWLLRIFCSIRNTRMAGSSSGHDETRTPELLRDSAGDGAKGEEHSVCHRQT